MRHYLSTGKAEGVQNPITGTWLISRSALFEFASARGQVPRSLRPQRTVLIVERPTSLGGELTQGVEAIWPGSRVTRLTNLFDALVQAAAIVPDLLVFDAELPELTGQDLLRILRRNSQTAGIRIVAVTGSPQQRSWLTAAGSDEVVFRNQYSEKLSGVLARLFPETKDIGPEWSDDKGAPRL
jgi:CheY-like chemotaxis protein